MAVFVRLVEEVRQDKGNRDAFNEDVNRYVFDAAKFKKLPGASFAYWLNERVIAVYENNNTIDAVYPVKEGLGTRDDARFLRAFWEVSARNVHQSYWTPTDKAGTNKRWYGGNFWVMDWRRDGYEIKNLRNADGSLKSRPQNTQWFFKQAVSWGKVGTGARSFRYRPDHFAFNDAAPSLFGDTGGKILSFLNSVVAGHLMRIQGGTINVTTSVVGSLPVVEVGDFDSSIVISLLAAAKEDWDSQEVSFDFRRSPLLSNYTGSHEEFRVDDVLLSVRRPRAPTIPRKIEAAYADYIGWCVRQIRDAARMETENNEYFVGLFDLQEQLSVSFPLDNLTLSEGVISRDALKHGRFEFYKREIVGQLVSYGVGCIFGRYSLDKDGLILANAGDDLGTYLSLIPEPTIRPDESGILPLTEDNDFADDLPSQWRAFLRAAFGDEHYEENLRFLENGLGKHLREYFLKGFNDDHVKRYKKRPIYWLITSPKGTLQALIYLHRYNRDTVNRFLNDYLRPYQQKLEAKRVSAEHILTGGGSSQSEKTKAQKRIDEIRKALEELSTWERDVVRPLAEKRIELDLDDGVKVNYGKLGAILAKVKGLNW